MFCSALACMASLYGGYQQKKRAEAGLSALVGGDYSSFGRGLTGLAPYKAKRHGKCPSCGSSEYVEHGGREVCAWCRSAA